MSKLRVLGFANFLLSLFFLFLLVTSGYSTKPLESLPSFIHAYAATGVEIFLLGVNVFLTYKIFFKKEKKPPYAQYLTLTLATVFWFAMLFGGYFIASNVIFPIVSILFILGIFFYFRKKSQKFAIFLSVVTFIVCLIVIMSSFEEDYCWRKGDVADPTGSQMVMATQTDVSALKEFNVEEGQKIGVSFRAHMLCHNNFNLIDAMKEKYFHSEKQPTFSYIPPAPADYSPKISSEFKVTNIDKNWDLLTSDGFGIQMKIPKGSEAIAGGGLVEKQIGITLPENVANGVVAIDVNFTEGKNLQQIAKKFTENGGEVQFTYTQPKEKTINNASGYELFGSSGRLRVYHFFTEKNDLYYDVWYYYPWNGTKMSGNEASVVKEVISSFIFMR